MVMVLYNYSQSVVKFGTIDALCAILYGYA